ncbi:MAG: aminotransferase class I/II-fold pyridoxal phosphate-dependent enzyme [Desulfobacterales bacterium]
MTAFNAWNPETLNLREQKLRRRYDGFGQQGLTLDLTRGKPSPEQLDLSQGLFDSVGPETFRAEDGTDCRNYGGLDGIPEAKRMFADYMEVAPEELIVGGNSSLNLMYDTFVRAMIHGLEPGHPPWSQLPLVRFLCPSPGYDRHFAICEHLGIEMVPVEMKEDGPDMEAVERLAAGDDAIKGIWCVPKYSNPTGVVYSDEVVERLASMPVKATDFRIFWDNAYWVHDLYDDPPRLANLLNACKKAGNPDRVLLFGSTSKITFPGSGVAFMAGSRRNMDWIRSHMFFQTIGHDKLNQLRHVRFFGDMAGIEAHMRRHAKILRPRFEAVQEVLDRELGGLDIATWSRPQGGYFASLDTLDGCAKRVIQLAGDVGVKLTPAGSTFPLKQDPKDRNIRIAPTFPPLDDIRTAMEVLAVSIQIAAIERGC